VKSEEFWFALLGNAFIASNVTEGDSKRGEAPF